MNSIIILQNSYMNVQLTPGNSNLQANEVVGFQDRISGNKIVYKSLQTWTMYKRVLHKSYAMIYNTRSRSQSSEAKKL